MSEHDDALLDDDFASLPDIDDEEYVLDISDEDATISTQESINEQLSCDLRSSLEDILDLTDLDAFEEFEKNTVVEPEANALCITNIKQENIKTDCSNEDRVQHNDKVILPIDEINLPKDNCSSDAGGRNVKQCEPDRQKSRNICANETEYQHIQSFEREYSSRRFDRCALNENHSYIPPINYTPSFYQPHIQDERVHLGLNNSPLLNEPYLIDHLNNSFLNQAHPMDRLPNQPVFCYNQNSYTNYGCPVPACLHHQLYPNPPFTNQVLPMQQPIQMSHGHMPMMTNACQPILIDSNRQMIYNQSNIIPNYSGPTYCDQPIPASQDQPQYVLNPLYNQNYSNKQKILVNRHFSPTRTRRDNWLCHEFNKTDLFLKKIATKKTKNQSWKSFSGSAANMDPYSYFSDIWQSKNGYESSKLRRSLSPEVFIQAPIPKKQKHSSKEEANHQQRIKLMKTCNISSSCSDTKKASNIRRRNIKLRNNSRRKPKNVETKTKNVDGNNKTSIKDRKKGIDFEMNKEEKLDPEMIEYCKKIEEQKRQRDKFLQEKESRRQLLAMEKVGVKIEPFTGY